MVNKYSVTVSLDIEVEARSKKVARDAVKDIPWDDAIKFEYPEFGLIRDFRIQAAKKAKIIKLVQR